MLYKKNLVDWRQSLFDNLAKSKSFPLQGTLILTYRCNYTCVHCYCKGFENAGKELAVSEWKKIIDKLYDEGCLWLTITGGEPLLRKDFLEIYSYARQKGFIITIFTNGLLLKGKILDYLKRFPPYSIEITINGITKDVYESITQVKGSFEAMKGSIAELKKSRLNVIFKSNCLKQNKDEIADIYLFVKKMLGKKTNYKYSPFIFPRINGDKAPCDYRISYNELEKISNSNDEFNEAHKLNLCDSVKLKRNRKFIYQCNIWNINFFVDPFGILKFCEFINKYGIDLKKRSFKYFLKHNSEILKKTFKKDSKCFKCDIRVFCLWCPAYAYLMTQDEEQHIDFLCKMAEDKAKVIKQRL